MTNAEIATIFNKSLYKFYMGFVADVFDALVSERCYKRAFSFDEAMDIIKKDAGSHFDPNVAEAFLQSRERVSEVMERITTEIPNKKK